MGEGFQWDYDTDSDKLSMKAAEQALNAFLIYDSFMSRDFDEVEREKSVAFLKKCQKALDEILAEKIKKLKGGERNEFSKKRLW